MAEKYLSRKRLKEILAAAKKKKVLVLGDIMLDRYLFGRVERISPEAPVPVFLREDRTEFRAGAAANVAVNIVSLGAKAAVMGCFGDERHGLKLKEILEAKGIFAYRVCRRSCRFTTTKTRLIARNQQLLRIDEEKGFRITGSEFLEITSIIKRELPNFDAVIVSDYGKGMVERRVLNFLLPLVRGQGKIITVDPKVEHFLAYKNVTSLTPNLDEAATGLNSLRKPATQKEVEELGLNIIRRLESDSLLITQGPDGMTLFARAAGRVSPVHIPTAAREVFDVSGAGDTVIASFTLALSAGASTKEAAAFANLAAGVVVGKMGAAAVSASEILEALILYEQKPLSAGMFRKR